MLTTQFLPVQIYAVIRFFAASAKTLMIFMDQWNQVPCNDCEIFSFHLVSNAYNLEQNRKNVRWSWPLVLNSKKGWQNDWARGVFSFNSEPNHISKQLKIFLWMSIDIFWLAIKSLNQLKYIHKNCSLSDLEQIWTRFHSQRRLSAFPLTQ